MSVNRKIIHIDMDCFYAAVEMRDNPSLKNKPIAIGDPQGKRGVLCTSNYEARKYGVKAAMPTFMALKKCPDLILIAPNFSKYKEVSSNIHQVFQEYTDKIEPLSLDEAYLDVSGVKLCQSSATLMAKEIKEKIFKRTGLTASAGIASNKFLAKVASDWKKPNGLFTIDPGKNAEFAKGLNVRLIPGVGKVFEEKLHSYNIKTCQDILSYSDEDLISMFGNMGQYLYYRARGIDDSPVISEWERKSLSVETTFSENKDSKDTLLDDLQILFDDFLYRLKKYKEKKTPSHTPYKIFIKLKDANFKSTSIERILCTDEAEQLWNNFVRTQKTDQFLEDLLVDIFNRSEPPFRLLGVGTRFRSEANNPQMELSL